MGKRLSALLIAAAAALSGCATPDLPMVTGEGWENSSRFRRLVVLPFSDGSGQGKQIAALVSGELGRSGYDIVGQQQAQALFKELRIEEGEELSLHTLADIRAKTLADAVVAGTVETSWKSVSVVAIDTREGDVVASTLAKAPFRQPFRHAEEVARAAAEALALAAGRGRRKP